MNRNQWIFSYDDGLECRLPASNPYCSLIRNRDWDKIGGQPSKGYNILDYAIVAFRLKVKKK